MRYLKGIVHTLTVRLLVVHGVSRPLLMASVLLETAVMMLSTSRISAAVPVSRIGHAHQDNTALVNRSPTVRQGLHAR